MWVILGYDADAKDKKKTHRSDLLLFLFGFCLFFV